MVTRRSQFTNGNTSYLASRTRQDYQSAISFFAPKCLCTMIFKIDDESGIDSIHAL